MRPGDALDREAEKRGNSVYFPDRVVPMLPEALSNELCSLKPGEDRACMAVHLWIDADGPSSRHRFVRGLMRSAARLTYEQVQAARDGAPDDPRRSRSARAGDRARSTAPSPRSTARAARGTLDLDLPERRDPARRERQGRAHRAARAPRQPPPDRGVHDHRQRRRGRDAGGQHSPACIACMTRPIRRRSRRCASSSPSIGILGLKLAKGQVIRPRHFNRLLAQVADTPYAAMVNELVLRSQAQAIYSPNNIGHFGLALRRYAHFTSPIRRYADLLVHRALIDALNLGEAGGNGARSKDCSSPLGEHVSMTERRAAAAERNASDRYISAFLADRSGAEFSARVNGVTRAGLFVTLNETGADGLIPIRSLPSDYYDHDEKLHRLVGRTIWAKLQLGRSHDC